MRWTNPSPATAFSASIVLRQTGQTLFVLANVSYISRAPGLEQLDAFAVDLLHQRGAAAQLIGRVARQNAVAALAAVFGRALPEPVVELPEHRVALPAVQALGKIGEETGPAGQRAAGSAGKTDARVGARPSRV